MYLRTVTFGHIIVQENSTAQILFLLKQISGVWILLDFLHKASVSN